MFNKAFLEWVSKHKFTFILVVLVAGNVYQYIEARRTHDRIDALQNEITDIQSKAIDYERERSYKLEKILQELVLTYKENREKK